MKQLAFALAAVGSVAMTGSAMAAPVIGANVTCTATGLVCSASQATVGAGTEFTGNFGTLFPLLAFDFSPGWLRISNANGSPYGVVARINFTFQGMEDGFTAVTLVSDNGFTGLSQANFSVVGGMLSFASTSFSATQGADLILQLDSAGAVPEPASWVMMILGLAMVGFGLRRRTGAVGASYGLRRPPVPVERCRRLAGDEGSA